jgi:predicted double-glycine peptidase
MRWRWRASIAALAALLAGGAMGQTLPPASGGEYQLVIVNYRDLPYRAVVRQQYDFSCGSAALATLLRYHYARPLSETDVFKAMWVSGDQAAIRAHGFSLADMKRYLGTIGIGADGYRVSLARLEQASIPAIAVVTLNGYKHFVVIKGIRAGQVLVGDPARGLVIWRADAFAKAWDGLIFVLHDPRDPGDHHGFNDAQAWGLVAAPPIGLATQRLPVVSDLAIDDIRTVFQVLPINVASTF